MIIGCDPMVKLGPKVNFGHQILECYETVAPMKDPCNFLSKPNLNRRDIQEVMMQTAKPAYTREYTKGF